MCPHVVFAKTIPHYPTVVPNVGLVICNTYSCASCFIDAFPLIYGDFGIYFYEYENSLIKANSNTF